MKLLTWKEKMKVTDKSQGSQRQNPKQACCQSEKGFVSAFIKSFSSSFIRQSKKKFQLKKSSSSSDTTLSGTVSVVNNTLFSSKSRKLLSLEDLLKETKLELLNQEFSSEESCVKYSCYEKNSEDSYEEMEFNKVCDEKDNEDYVSMEFVRQGSKVFKGNW